MTSISDVQLVAGTYVELYAATGIAVGTSLLIQNKTSSTIVVQNRVTQPANNDFNGFIISYLGVWVVEAGASGVWVRGDGAIAVEAR